MAYARKSSGGNYSRSTGGRSKGRAAAGGRGKGKAKPKQQREGGNIYVSKFNARELDNYDSSKNYPLMTGWLNIEPEYLQKIIEEGEVNPEYGTVGLRVSLWKNQDGSLGGTVQLPQPAADEPDDDDEEVDNDF